MRSPSSPPDSAAAALDAGDRAAVDAALHVVCDRSLHVLPPGVAAAVRYSLLGPGKRLRPILLLAAYRAAGGSGNASALAASVEVVHSYSLVHDDLPCMDDDDLRRGRPTTHRVYGIAHAMTAGLVMVPLAVRTAMDAARGLGLPDAACGAIVRKLMQASGGGGMVGGQLLDLEGEGRLLSLAELERIHRAKTGSLIAAAVEIGAMAADASDDVVGALAEYGNAVGLAFQVTDDVLDATASSDQLGKTAGRDAVLRKSTYPALLGVEGAMARARAFAEQACLALERSGVLTPSLERLAHFAVARQR
ncbi:MAG TPA: farnesyl diphosphate synthase [Gemmatimonadaceae bacterium]|nr:farnesyl diphosphate synthase [Gemmatimonadaceae bacterium]